jgi:hypothetical protein
MGTVSYGPAQSGCPAVGEKGRPELAGWAVLPIKACEPAGATSGRGCCGGNCTPLSGGGKAAPCTSDGSGNGTGAGAGAGAGGAATLGVSGNEAVTGSGGGAVGAATGVS